MADLPDAESRCDYFGRSSHPDCIRTPAYEARTPDGPGVLPLCVEHAATVRRLMEGDRRDGGPLSRWEIRTLSVGTADG